MGQLGTGGAAKTEEFLKKFLRGGKAHFQSKTLPKALRTQVLTALTSSFGLIWFSKCATFAQGIVLQIDKVGQPTKCP